MKKYRFHSLFLGTALLLGACAPQSTPSMMSTERPRLEAETSMLQIPVANVSQGALHKIAQDYDRFGTDTLHLALGYDPKSKSYGAMKAFEDLADIKAGLKKYGVRSVTAETVQVDGGEPTLMITYDSLKAAAPPNCRNMPGFDDGLTTREIGDYKFGCSVDTMLAKQIYRPADLMGNGETDAGDGRRAANTVEHYRNVTAEETEGHLENFERDDMTSD